MIPPAARPWLLRGFIVALPFAVFWWLCPFAGRLTIGHDYTTYPMHAQMELQYSIAHGTWPLYAPGFAGGRSAAALTLGGLHHPLSHVAAHSPGYWSGLATEWTTLWRLLSLGVAQLVLFGLLRRLGLGVVAAFIASFLTAYNQRTLDMLRYGAAFENHVGFLLLCGAIGHAYLSPGGIAGPLSVVGATWLLTCGGHPQMAWLGAMGAVLFTLLWPSFVAMLRPDLPAGRRRPLRFVALMLGCGLVGLLVSSSYTFPFIAEFHGDAPRRVGRDYAWSLGNSDTPAGFFANFILPLHGNLHGAFGGSPLFLPAMLAPVVVAFGGRGPGRRFAIALSLAAALVALVSLGEATPLHRILWEWLPFASSFRTPGRFTLVLLPLLMMGLAWLFHAATDATLLPDGPRLLVVQSGLLFLIGGGAILLGLDPASSSRTSPSAFAGVPRWVDPVTALLALATLATALLAFSGEHVRRNAMLGLAALVVLQAAVQLRYGTWTRPRTPTPSLAMMDEAKAEDLAFRGKPGFGMEAAIRLSPSARSGPKVSFRPDGGPATLPGEAVTCRFASFNRLEFHSELARPGTLVLAVPWSDQWKATLDDGPAAIRRTDLDELALPLPAGSHVVDFRFSSPASVAGMSVSLVTLGVIGLSASRFAPRRMRIAAAIAAILVPLGLGLAWNRSLHGGGSLKTAYHWPASR